MEFSSIALNVSFFFILFWVCSRAIQCVTKGESAHFVEYAPSLLTSLGLLGTFMGIFFGLWHFDTNRIDSSIPELLDGLKTAFITSIMGMSASIYFKFRQNSILDAKTNQIVSENAKEEVTSKDIYAVLQAQHKTLQIMSISMCGDSDNSIVGQIKLLRTDMMDLRSTWLQRQANFETKLWEQFNQFAEMLSKSATEQVIEALKNVIVEFNEKLSEQFGDNFKRLDESVKKLVDWQTLYMAQMEQMIQQYALGVQAIDDTKVAVQKISVETEKIPANMGHLETVLEVNQHQIQELTRHLDSFVQMRNQAIIAVPNIQEKLEEIGQHLHDGAQKVNHILIQGSEEFRDSVYATNQNMMKAASEIADHSEQISSEMTKAMDTLALNTERIQGGITSAISDAMDSLNVNTQQMTRDATDCIYQTLHTLQREVAEVSKEQSESIETTLSKLNSHVLNMGEGVKKTLENQLGTLDKGLTDQLNTALNDLGSALASITNHMIKTTYDQQIRKDITKNQADYTTI